MRKREFLRLGFPANDKFIKIETIQGKRTFQAMPSLVQYIGVLDEIFNFTFVTDFKSVGSYQNGTYNNILGQVQKKEIDLLWLASPFAVENDAFTYSGPVMERFHSILSFTKSIKRETRYVIESINSFDLPSWLCLLFLLLAYALVFYLYKTNLRLIDIMAQILEHYYVDYSCERKRLISFSITVYLSIIFWVVNAGFSTSLTAVIVPEKFETLEDVVKYKAVPVFIEAFGTHDYFLNPVTKIASQVWNNPERKLYTLTTVFTGIGDMVSIIGGGNSVALCPRHARVGFTLFFCEFFKDLSKKLLDQGQTIYTSQPFTKTLHGFPVRLDLSYEKWMALKICTYLQMENGFEIRFYNNLMIDIANVALSTEAEHLTDCNIKIMENNVLNITVEYEDMRIGSYKYTMLSFVSSMFISIIIWIHETLENNIIYFMRRFYSKMY